MKNPFINALLAVLYIAIIALVMFSAPKVAEQTVLMPIAMLSLFTLSAAVMGYLFIFQPFQLYFDGKRQEAIKAFLQTVLTFAILTLLVFGLLFIF